MKKNFKKYLLAMNEERGGRGIEKLKNDLNDLKNCNSSKSALVCWIDSMVDQRRHPEGVTVDFLLSEIERTTEKIHLI
jgi:hypothetical protein